jgi:FkbM family methyltransferase
MSVTGYYDWRNLAIAAAVCREGETIIEVGANVGTETVGFAGLVGRSGHVIAFEPVPSNSAGLRNTLALNPHLNVTLFQNAVGEACTTLRFCAPRKKEDSGLGHIVVPVDTESGDQVDGDQVEIECLTLDSISDKLGSARLLSIDVEGFEVSVLRGAASYLLRNRPVIVLEAVQVHQKRAGRSLAELHAILIHLGYRIRTIDTISLGKVDLSDSAKGTNWLCVHEEQPDLFRHITNVMRRVAFMPCVPGLNPICRKAFAS